MFGITVADKRTNSSGQEIYRAALDVSEVKEARVGLVVVGRGVHLVARDANEDDVVRAVALEVQRKVAAVARGHHAVAQIVPRLAAHDALVGLGGGVETVGLVCLRHMAGNVTFTC